MTKLHCPNCNSLQTFPLKTRREGDEIVSFIKCRQCRQESIIRRETPDHRLRRVRLMRQKRK